MKFITINDLNEVCFKDDDINIITDKDKPISDAIYAMFFEQQSMGKQFKIKNFNGATFDEIFEEYQLTYEDLNEQPTSETDELKQRIANLEAMVEALLREKQS